MADPPTGGIERGYKSQGLSGRLIAGKMSLTGDRQFSESDRLSQFS
jgi:hypothetical protein